jgi:conjugative transfer signal peptidase TraF
MSARLIAGAAMAFAGGLCIIAATSQVAGLRLNFSASAPTGIWRVVAAESETIRRGDLVEVCAPLSTVVIAMRRRGALPPGDCPADVAPLLKPVVAVAGDQVQISAGMPVIINGIPLSGSRAAANMPSWPVGTYTLPNSTIWLGSSYSASSFDSRYFGPVPIANVRGHATPVLVAGDISKMIAWEDRP